MTFIKTLSKFSRRKYISKEHELDTKLSRVLTTTDLVFLGVGSTMGIGVYVLSGSVAKFHSGPAIIISFLVAAIASIFSGLCYAEFGSRVPKAGSAFVYSYVCIGELIAFIIGWNLVMEYLIGMASVAKGYSHYLDAMFNKAMEQSFRKYLPISIPHLSPYFDPFAFTVTLFLTFLLAFGVKKSSWFMNIFTGVKIFVAIFFIVAGSFFADIKNWKVNVTEIDMNMTDPTDPDKPIHPGDGGFAPFGFEGIMQGAAICFFAFVGFDSIASTGEETKNPSRSIPLAIIISLAIIFLSYCGISIVITLMVPYYLQDSNAPISYAFKYVDFPVGKWIITIGALFGLSTTLLGTMFPLPRVIYAMASDGLLFPFLALVNPKFKTPMVATILSGTLGALLASLFELDTLVEMMSIGTLAAYTLVSICVIVLRYRMDESDSSIPQFRKGITFRDFLGQIFNVQRSSDPTYLSSKYTEICIVAYCIFTIGFCSFSVFAKNEIVKLEIFAVTLLSLFFILMILSLLSLSLQPTSKTKLGFKVPLVPLIPALGILTNIYLVMKLNVATWARFGVWMALGFIIYFFCFFTGRTDSVYYAVNSKNCIRMEPTKNQEKRASTTVVLSTTDSNI